MLIAAFVIWLQKDTPKTFEELELAKISALHEIKGYRAVMKIVGVGPDNSTVSAELAWNLDGARAHFKVKSSALPEVETVSDGTAYWLINPAAKQYCQGPVPKPGVFDPRGSLLKTAADRYQFNFGTDLQVEFAFNPNFVLTSLESVKDGDSTLRKAVSVATNSRGKTLTLTQWFLPDAWILKRFTVSGRNEKGELKMTGELSTLDRHAQFADSEFRLDPASVVGYQKVDPPPLPGGGGR